MNNIIFLIVLMVVLSTLISSSKKNFFNVCDHKLDPFVLGFVIEASLAIIFAAICLFRYNKSKKEIAYITSHNKSYYLAISIFLTALMTFIYYKVLTRVRLSSMSTFRSCLSIIMGLVVSFVLLKEKLTKDTIIGAILIIAATYFIHKGAGKDFSSE